MGLRMYDDPDEIKAKQPAIETDPTARARSVIRRARTVRYSSSTRPPSFYTVSSNVHRPNSSHGPTGSSSGLPVYSDDTRRRIGPSSHPSRRSAAEVARLGPGMSSAQVAEYVRFQEANQRTLRERNAALNAALGRRVPSSERSGGRARTDDDNTVPNAPETLHSGSRYPAGEPIDSLDYSEEALRAQGRYLWPTRPFSSGESSESSRLHRALPPLGTAALTPSFAPAHGQSRQAAGDRTVEVQTFAIRQNSLTLLSQRMPSPLEAVNDQDRNFLITLASELEAMRNMTPDMLTAPYLVEEGAYLRSVEIRLNLLSVNGTGESRSNALDDLPALRRTGQERETAHLFAAAQQRRMIQRMRARHDALDGLGDRQRSFSPDDDAWETMLTTITPDERVPSAHSSFTTATAASATSRSSNRARTSHGTPATFPSSTATSAEIEACPAEGSVSPSASDDDHNIDHDHDNEDNYYPVNSFHNLNQSFFFQDSEADAEGDWLIAPQYQHNSTTTSSLPPPPSSGTAPADPSTSSSTSLSHNSNLASQHRYHLQQSRLEYLSRRLARHRAEFEAPGRRSARDAGLEADLRRMEGTVRGLIFEREREREMEREAERGTEARIGRVRPRPEERL